MKQYSAFTMGNLGFFECVCMPFGLCNAPATFQRLMLNCLGEMSLSFCIFYLDDVLIFLKIEEEYMQHLCITFEHFWEHNLRLNPPSVNSSRMILTIWPIMSPKMGWGWAKRTWKLWRSLLCLKPTQKSEPFWAWWGSIGHSSIQGVFLYCTIPTWTSVRGRCQ